MRAAKLVPSAGLILAGWLALAFGQFSRALIYFIALMVTVRAIVVISRAMRGTLETGLYQQPFAPGMRRQLFGAVNAWLFWLTAAVTLEMGMIPAQVGSDGHLAFRIMLWSAMAVLLALELLPGKEAQRRLGAAFAVGTLFMFFEAGLRLLPAPTADTVTLAPPFHDPWVVIQGGPGSLINHHYSLRSQRHAVDFSKISGERVYNGDRKQNQAYASWGAELFAPADGTVVAVAGNFPDNVPGHMTSANLLGNHIVIDMGGGRFVLMAHLQQGSPRVTVGDKVKTGQFIAACGNSGHSASPHLHLQVQNRADFFAKDLATYPMLFQAAFCRRGSQVLSKGPFYVRRNDRLVSH